MKVARRSSKVVLGRVVKRTVAEPVPLVCEQATHSAPPVIRQEALQVMTSCFSSPDGEVTTDARSSSIFVAAGPSGSLEDLLHPVSAMMPKTAITSPARGGIFKKETSHL